MTISKRKLNAPILFIQLYLSFTVVFFFFGPRDWPVSNRLSVFLILILYQAMLYLGYKKGIKKNYRKSNYDYLFKYSFYLSWFTLIFQYMTITGDFSFSITNFINKVIIGLKSPDIAYNSEYKNSTALRIVNIIYSIFSPITFIFIPASIYHWKNTKPITKFSVVFFITMFILMSISRGINKGIFDIFIIIFSVIFIKIIELDKGSYFKFKIKKNHIIALIGFLLILFMFNKNISRRLNLKKPMVYDMILQKELNTKSPFYTLVPDPMKNLVVFLNGYLTQGYYGMSLAMKIDHKPTYGLGHSNVLINLADNIISIEKNNYQVRIEKKFGWDKNIRWHSAYTWWANDITFFLIPIVLFLLGRLTAMVWVDILVNKNIVSTSLFSLIMIMAFYLPANNQVFQSLSTLSAFWGLLLLFNRR